MVARFYPESEDKIRTVPLGVSTRFVYRDDPENDEKARAQYRVPEDYLLYVGRRQKRKNVMGLLDSYTRALVLEPDLPQLVIVGPGGEGTKDVLRRVARHPLRGRVLLLDDLPDVDLPAVYRGALGLLFPCRYEGFGLPVLEAMACGCPVIVSDEGGLPELVQDAGIKVEPADTQAWAQAMVTLTGDEQRRRRMAEAGLELARPYTWRATAEATREAYGAALGR